MPYRLALAPATWHGRTMASPPSTAGGVLIAIGAILGTVVGFVAGEPTGGLLVGLVGGVVAALLIWARQRRPL